MSDSQSVGKCLVVSPMVPEFYFFFLLESSGGIGEKKKGGKKKKKNEIRVAIGYLWEDGMEVQ